ncbi:uncharacterized protein FMAN_09923 [Fusarium mangiferae]|uniref:Uncharacterized protein n=1 Tax=Fusarium mangiferae TaxID=192010 RepID=A0A1L7TPD1_FUSMA|nr:uncharacterized protein FMAN_09923 [Fusarium mangiferae]CVL00500.1 uncharacterized protein FMAN_09923 [Fusarium mangiferae]
MPSVIASHEYPEAFQVDTNDAYARLQYFFDVATYFGSLDHQTFQVVKDSCIERVCNDFERMVCHLGEEAPEFPWTLDQFPRRERNLPDIYREWLIANDLVAMYWGPHSISRSEDGN